MPHQRLRPLPSSMPWHRRASAHMYLPRMHKLRPALAPQMFTVVPCPWPATKGVSENLGTSSISPGSPATVFQSKVLHSCLTDLVLWQVMAHRCVHWTCLWLLRSLKLHSAGRPCVGLRILSIKACPTRVPGHQWAGAVGETVGRGEEVLPNWPRPRARRQLCQRAAGGPGASGGGRGQRSVGLRHRILGTGSDWSHQTMRKCQHDEFYSCTFGVGWIENFLPAEHYDISTQGSEQSHSPNYSQPSNACSSVCPAISINDQTRKAWRGAKFSMALFGDMLPALQQSPEEGNKTSIPPHTTFASKILMLNINLDRRQNHFMDLSGIS